MDFAVVFRFSILQHGSSGRSDQVQLVGESVKEEQYKAESDLFDRFLP
jgi:hypothetical protein